jgi:uncharacterized protein
LTWFTKSAAQGLAHPQYIIGLMHLDGQGVAQSKTEGIHWLQKAADQGHPEAIEALKKFNH